MDKTLEKGMLEAVNYTNRVVQESYNKSDVKLTPAEIIWLTDIMWATKSLLGNLTEALKHQEHGS